MTMVDSTTSARIVNPDLIKLKNYIIGRISTEVETKDLTENKRKEIIRQKIHQVYQQTNLKLTDSIRMQVFDEVINSVIGYGPIQSLLDDPNVNEIMVNGYQKIFIETKGQLIKTGITFDNDEHVVQVIERIIQPIGRRICADSPAVDARLPDGSRIHAIIPPVAIDGPSITIRKFSKDKLKTEDLIRLDSMNAKMAEFLRACVVGRLNIIISGGTGSGKTTLLNVLSGFIPENERIITIEDTAELQLQQEHVVRLETKNRNVDGSGEMTIRDLVKHSLRMRPNRIVVGECRGGEALDMLQAMNTGHDGSITTLHANSPRDALSRLETLVLMAGMDLPINVVRKQITSAVDLVVQLSRLRDGTRRITAITEVAGMEGETIVMTDIFKFDITAMGEGGKVIGEFKPTGMRPMFMPRLEIAGCKLNPEIFSATIAETFEKSRKR